MKTEDAVYLKSSRVRNTLPGTEGTYHDTVASIDLCDLDTFAERAGKKCGYAAAIVKNVIGAVGMEAQEIISTRLYRVHAPGMTFEAAISGSVPSIDAPLTEENKAYVAIRPTPDLKNVADAIVPVRSDNGATVALDRVQDEASGKPNVIVGTQPFILTGWGLSTSGEGEGVTAESLVNGTKAVAAVSRNDHGQSVWAALDRALPAGKAKVCVMTRGNSSNGDLWPVYKTVTVLAGDVPPGPVGPLPVVTQINAQGVDENPVVVTSAVTFIGEHFDNATLKVSYDDGQGGTVEHDLSIYATGSTDTVLSTEDDWYQEAGLASNFKDLTFTITNANGSTSVTASYQPE